MNKWKSLIVNLAIPLAVGGLSAFLSREGMQDYVWLNQPPLAPPGWVFPVVWTILYVLMGIGAWKVWNTDPIRRRTPLRLYAVQLVFNFFWSLIFFGAGLYGAALLWLFILWILVLATTMAFRMTETNAGAFLVPYALWVTFALYLNAGVWWLNR